MELKLIKTVGRLAVDIDTVKQAIGVRASNDQITQLIIRATGILENHINRTIQDKHWMLTSEQRGDILHLPMPMIKKILLVEMKHSAPLHCDGSLFECDRCTIEDRCKQCIGNMQAARARADAGWKRFTDYKIGKDGNSWCVYLNNPLNKPVSVTYWAGQEAHLGYRSIIVQICRDLLYGSELLINELCQYNNAGRALSNEVMQ